MSPPTQYLQPPHPRRPPAHRSVSLRQSPPSYSASSHSKASTKSSNDPDSGRSDQSRGSASSLIPRVGKDDSGESSNADKWFEKSNNHINGPSQSYVDHSPPFFLRNPSSDETPPELKYDQCTRDAMPPAGSLPLHPSMLRFGTDGSSTEDFRGVIDDLTVENKKLKRKLRAYEKLQDHHLKDQKLFEVRVHGLPGDKRRELEDMLRKFATSLHGQSAPDVASSLYNGHLPGLLPQETISSNTASNFNDSAYASASASGQDSAQSSSDTRKKHFPRKSRQNIQNYLHDIPEGLLPQSPVAMTEKARKKLIVRRLEQVFAGKGAASSANQQPLQQQEVSQMAAKADRSAMETSGQQAPIEGLREARIMPEEGKGHSSEESLYAAIHKIGEQDFAVKDSEQRPTRPLDLDIQRAQVPAENIQYIRHLGFSPPWAESMESPANGHGWIYLNLLANMAQIHTINVTPEFVMKALQEYSKKFEVSEDGRKVRWKGGRSMTRDSSEGAESPAERGITSPERGSPRKRMKMSQPTVSQSGGRSQAKQYPDSRLSYTPLFQHQNSETSSDTSSDEGEATGSGLRTQHGESSGMTSSGGPNAYNKRCKRQEAAPMIFYNKARFCTDLSGDSKIEEAMRYNPHLYHSCTKQPVGTAASKVQAIPQPRETRGSWCDMQELPEAMDLDDSPIALNMELEFPPQSPISSQAGKDRKTYDLEASGIGGTCPADNFAINVDTLHAPLDSVGAAEGARAGAPARYPHRITNLLQDQAVGRKARTAFHKEIVSTHHTELPPSRLPDASCFMSFDGDTTPEDYEEGMDNNVSIGSDSPNAALYVAPQPIEMDFVSTDEEVEDDEDDDDDDDKSDGSLDLLAIARELDPEAIRKRELEYDANMAERLAEEIPTGSSAATAGGGSGCNSPADQRIAHNSEEVLNKARLLRRESTASIKPGLKRARTGDSMTVNGRDAD